MNRFAPAAALLAALPFFGTAHAGEDELMQALREELARSIDELRMEELDRPYFIAYTVQDIDQRAAAASFGAQVPSAEGRRRQLGVEVRVGDADFDNTNFRSRTSFNPRLGITAILPLTDNVVELRRQIWLATDRAYKTALEALAKKRAALQNGRRSVEIGDFAAEEAHSYREPPEGDIPPLGELQSLVGDLSRLFTEMPDIATSSAVAAVRHQRTYYVNSEGSSFVRNDPGAMVVVSAGTQSADGTLVQDAVTAYGTTWDEIDDPEGLEAKVTAMGQAITARRSADDIDRYLGPVLFEGQAAAEIFARVMVPRLLGIRVPDTEPQYAGSMRGNPFLDKLGARVMSRFLNLRDDPTLRGNGFVGGFAVDDEGVPARVTPLVENGILKTLLTTRNPIVGIGVSNGNRRGTRPSPSNLVLESTRGMNREELLAELMLLVKEREGEYGIIVRRLGSPWASSGQGLSSQGQGSVDNAALAYKVFPDGREELIRQAEFATVVDYVFKEIVATSETSTTYSYGHTRSTQGGFIGTRTLPLMDRHIVSVSVPDLLFEELTLRKPTANVPRPPVAGHPFFDESKGLNP